MNQFHQKYVIHPDLRLEAIEPTLTITIPMQRKRISSQPRLLELLRYFQQPKTLQSAQKRFNFTNKIRDFLILEGLIIPAELVNLYSKGLLFSGESTIGKAINLPNLQQNIHEKRWCIFGVPVSFETYRSCSPAGGPNAIRSSLSLFNLNSTTNDKTTIFDWNRQLEVSTYDTVPFDLGDLYFDSRKETIKDFHQKIRYVTDSIVQVGAYPLVLGGEHVITEPIIESLFEKYQRLTIIHFDAHTDRYMNSYRNQDNLSSGNVFKRIIQHKKFHQLYQIGVREYERDIISETLSEKQRCFVISAYEIQLMHDPKQIFASLNQNDPIYISIDADVLDPVYAPEVAWPVMGGLTYFQMYHLINYLVENFHVVGMDLVEVCGQENGRNLAASCLSNFATILLLSQPFIKRHD